MIFAGCPVSNRAWIIKHWVNHIHAAAEYANEDLEFVVCLPESDKDTRIALMESAAKYRRRVHWITSNEQALSIERVWNPDRYTDMAFYRNSILNYVRVVRPDYFLSVDSDILVSIDVIEALKERLRHNGGKFDAVAGKVWLSPTSKNITNYAILNKGNLRRQDSSGCFQVDVIMALKLMSPEAYFVDYEPHEQGEDIGWSIAARDRGLKLGFDGSVVSKHVMQPELLERVDVRVGW